MSKGDIRTVYSLCKGLLQYCDWVASADEKPLQQNLSQNELKDKIKNKVEADGYQYVERDFHKNVLWLQGGMWWP